jgi:hypothetical protein
VDNDAVASIATLDQLIQLELGWTGITDNGLRALGRLKNLRFLFINDTAISDVGLTYLLGLDAIEEVYAARSKVTPAGLSAFFGPQKKRPKKTAEEKPPTKSG